MFDNYSHGASPVWHTIHSLFVPTSVGRLFVQLPVSLTNNTAPLIVSIYYLAYVDDCIFLSSACNCCTTSGCSAATFFVSPGSVCRSYNCDCCANPDSTRLFFNQSGVPVDCGAMYFQFLFR